MMAKYNHGDPEENIRLAREAFDTAFRINPELPLAHNYYTSFEIEEMGHSTGAMLRLLDRAQKNAADPDLFAGLVLACRSCGLNEASLAAHRRAKQLDPGMRTGVQHTYFMMHDYPGAMETDDDDPPFIRTVSMAMLGQEDEAVAVYRRVEAHGLQGVERSFVTSFIAALEKDRSTFLESSTAILKSRFRDPEGLYFGGRMLTRVGENEKALDLLDRVVAGGLYNVTAFAGDPWLEPLRGHPRFEAILERAREGREMSRKAFLEAGGERLLGVS
jgi:hypothetical protein